MKIIFISDLTKEQQEEIADQIAAFRCANAFRMTAQKITRKFKIIAKAFKETKPND